MVTRATSHPHLKMPAVSGDIKLYRSDLAIKRNLNPLILGANQFLDFETLRSGVTFCVVR
jgi:hypothetical protein